MKKLVLKVELSKVEQMRAARRVVLVGRGNAAGIHADQKGRYGKRQRSQNRADERAAKLSRD